jgi:hypothetical protein
MKLCHACGEPLTRGHWCLVISNNPTLAARIAEHEAFRAALDALRNTPPAEDGAKIGSGERNTKATTFHAGKRLPTDRNGRRTA